MKITIEAEPKEIAALVAELQERPVGECELDVDGAVIAESVWRAIRGRPQASEV